MSHEKPNIIVDFDGVLHSYTSGWLGPAVCPDPPVQGAETFLAGAVKYFTVNIVSSRSNKMEGLKAMEEYCERHFGSIITDQLKFPTTKPPAVLTIDDRAFQFRGEWPTVEEIKKFLPWKQGKPSNIFDSTDDARVQKNVFRHQYRQLTGDEKAQMRKIKDQALVMYTTITEIGDSREMSLAKTRLEEVVMWAVKHITG